MSMYNVAPDSITVSGAEYPIDTDFRFWIRFQGVLMSGDTDRNKAKKICNIMIELGIPPTKETLDAMLDFYAGASTENKTGGGKNVRSFDFEKDSEYIFSAFLEFYGIDLSVAKLHWWKFKALFKALPDDCQMCKIMMYRTIDLKNVPKEQKKFYREMKARYALADVRHGGYRTEQEMKEYVKRRFEEAKSRLSEMRGDQQPSMDKPEC